METLTGTSIPVTSNSFLSHNFVFCKSNKRLSVNPNQTLKSLSLTLTLNGLSSCFPISSENRLIERKKVVAVSAKKSDDDESKIKKKKKVDSHSYVPTPDEATGPFPEAVLLKQKKVMEDGSFLPEFADEDERQLFEYLNLQLESELNVDQMRHYEVVYLIHQDHKDAVESVNSKVEDFIREKKGRVWRFSDWGMRRLAYKIKKATHAHYILMNFELGAQWINDFKSMLDLDERVIRHLVIKRDKAETELCSPPPEFHALRANMDGDDVDDVEYDDEDWEDDGEDYEEDDNEDYEEDDADINSDDFGPRVDQTVSMDDRRKLNRETHKVSR